MIGDNRIQEKKLRSTSLLCLQKNEWNLYGHKCIYCVTYIDTKKNSIVYVLKVLVQMNQHTVANHNKKLEIRNDNQSKQIPKQSAGYQDGYLNQFNF